MRCLSALGAFGLLAVASAISTASQSIAQEAASWEIGPDVRGRNYSVGMPLKPTPVKRGVWSFDFPQPNADAGHVHAVTFNPGPLLKASKIIMRYRIDAVRGVRFAPQETPDQPATVSLYFQRRGDSWSAKGRYEFYRWYAPAQSVKQVAPGEHQIIVSLSDPQWISVMGKTVVTNPGAFQAALAETSQIGIAFGGPSGRAHGAFSTGPARFTLLEFRVI